MMMGRRVITTCCSHHQWPRSSSTSMMDEVNEIGVCCPRHSGKLVAALANNGDMDLMMGQVGV